MSANSPTIIIKNPNRLRKPPINPTYLYGVIEPVFIKFHNTKISSSKPVEKTNIPIEPKNFKGL